MKNLIIVAALLTSTSAFASKARLTALQGADHLIDTQSVFTYPSHLGSLSPYLTLEFGAAGTDAEGGILKSLANGDRLLLYVGHKHSTAAVAPATDLRTGNGYIGQNNPIEIMYGMGNQGFGLSLSTVDNKKAATKETTVIIKYGITVDTFTFFAHATAISAAEKATAGHTDKISGPRLTLGMARDAGDYHFFGSATYGDAKNELTAGDVKIKDMNVNLGFEDRSLKNANSDIYFGALIMYADRDIDGKKITSTSLPVFLGLEHTLTTWAVFRGSVSQNLLVGSVKDETAAVTDADGIASNTTAAAGIGLKYSQLQIDGTLTAATDGKVNGNAFLAQTSVTYNF